MITLFSFDSAIYMRFSSLESIEMFRGIQSLKPRTDRQREKSKLIGFYSALLEPEALEPQPRPDLVLPTPGTEGNFGTGAALLVDPLRVTTGAPSPPHRTQEAFPWEQVPEAQRPLKVARPARESHTVPRSSPRHKFYLEKLSKAMLDVSSPSSTSDPNERNGLPPWASCSRWRHS